MRWHPSRTNRHRSVRTSRRRWPRRRRDRARATLARSAAQCNLEVYIMFKRKYARSLMKAIFSTRPVSPFGMESLEDRRLLSGGGGHHHGGGGGDFGGGFDGGRGGATIQ